MQGKQIPSLNQDSLNGWSFFSLVHFWMVLGNKYKVNLRANSSQQGEEDGDQGPKNQVNVPTLQPSQEKESKAQELAQMIKNIMAAQST